jgi:predicted O-methyltransferase YrrM
MELEINLDKGTLLSRTILCKAKMMCGYEESAEYNDFRYYPFFYYLGQKVSPSRVLQVGAKAGLVANCFLQTCKFVTQWNYWMTPCSSTTQINTEMFLSKEFGIVRWLPELTAQDKFDLIFITELSENVNECLKQVWKHLNPKGLLVIDYINEGIIKTCFEDFCGAEDREPVYYKTRYGTGIIER